MTNLQHAVELTQSLVQIDTVNPPGNEHSVCQLIQGLLEPAGFDVVIHNFGPGRSSLVARLPATQPRHAPIVFSGHADTVPLGGAHWVAEPFGGVIKDGRIYGRGSSDMKSGIAAAVMAALALAEEPTCYADIVIVVAAAEETGSEGVVALAADGEALGECGLLVVAEPTDNRPMLGHKGALWAELQFWGVTAHGAMPNHGDNAVYKACEAVQRLRSSDFFHASHPVMGDATLNVGYLHGGDNLNSVPDSARLGLDMRTLPEQNHRQLLAQIRELIGDEGVVINPLVDLPAVYTDPTHPSIQLAFGLASEHFGQTSEAATAHFFTDASVLTGYYGGVPTLIMGPGPMHMAHQTDEDCDVDAIRACTDYFIKLGAGYIR